MTRLLPGITIRTHDFAHVARAVNQSPDADKRNRCSVSLGDWMVAELETRYRLDQAACLGPQVSVLLDGYLAECEQSAPPSQPARRIAELYQRSGTDFLLGLRGSYVCLIVDHVQDCALLFNDRRGSRPLFRRQGGGSAVASEVRHLALLPPALEEMDEGALAEFLIFGSYYDDRSLFQGIRKIPPASVLTFRQDGQRLAPYWSLRFTNEYGGRVHEDLADECDHLIRQATRRLLAQLQRPVLLLSGGVDSRAILGAMLAEGHTPAAATYGTGEGDDCAVAKSIANHCGLELIEYRIPPADPSVHFAAAALDSDCRAETIDTPSIGPLHLALAGRFDGFFNGDECFGWHGIVTTPDQAFDAVAMYRLQDVNRLEDWLVPSKRRQLRMHVEGVRRDLAARIGQDDANGLKDALYHHARAGNMLNAFAASKLRLYEQARPLLDEDLIDFIARLPNDAREEKKIIRLVLERQYPELHRLPFSQRDSLPTADVWRKRIGQDREVGAYFRHHLGEALDDRLGAIFDMGKVGRFVTAAAGNKRFPATNVMWWESLPGMWRVAQRLVRNRVHPIRLMMRLLQVHLYLTEIRSQTSRNWLGDGTRNSASARTA